MIITITPEDLVKRCLWNNYKKFCLKDEDEKSVEKIVVENKPFAITENDAFVIGLLKVVETENVIHRFKTDMNNYLNLKTTIQKVEEEKMLLINKSTVINDCINFKNHFPEYYNSDAAFRNGINDLNEFINSKLKELEELKVYEIIKLINNKKKKIVYIQSKDVSKLFKLNTVDE